ncbi:MAG: hypothetical protein II812_02460, partial [Prevotella sp.]|nr:hypothetical protein [Prevotella sp.]
MTKRNIISKRHVTTVTLLAIMITAQAQLAQQPKMIVNITVDQLTTEGLQNSMSQLSERGLKRL